MNTEPTVTNFLLPTLVTMIGWLVAGIYAVRQVNVAHEKNRELQKEQDNRSILIDINKQFLQNYLDTSLAIKKFQSTMFNIYFNMLLNERLESSAITVEWKELVIKLEKCHEEVGNQLQIMKTLHSCMKSYLPDSCEIEDAFTCYNDAFGFGATDDKPYIKMTALLTGMIDANNNDPKLLMSHIEPTKEALNKVSNKLDSFAQSVHVKLFE